MKVKEYMAMLNVSLWPQAKLYVIVCVLMRCIGDCPQLIKSPYQGYCLSLGHNPLLMAHYIRLRNYESEDDTAQCLIVSSSEVICHRMCADEVHRRLPTAHQITISSISYHWDINHCSKAITFGYDIVEAKMALLNVSLYPQAKLCHRMCPDEVH